VQGLASCTSTRLSVVVDAVSKELGEATTRQSVEGLRSNNQSGTACRSATVPIKDPPVFLPFHINDLAMNEGIAGVAPREAIARE
jgi:hypothetical protein